MKFAMRFIHQIIGLLIIGALGIVAFAIVMLGANQRWFSQDFQYKTYFNSATGLGPNMPVLYKGITIGRVKYFKLSDDDQVEVYFTIFDTYGDRVRQGSMVEIQISPIGGLGGNQFMFYPGTGSELIPSGDTIYAVHSDEGKRLVALGLAVRPEADDSINSMMNQASSILNMLNQTLTDVQDSIEGSEGTSLGRSMSGLEKTLNEFPDSIQKSLDEIVNRLNPVLDNLEQLTGTLSSAEAGNDLMTSLNSLAGTLQHLEEIAGYVPAQLPQLTLIVADLQRAVESINDVVISISNNPLLKNGIPEHQETPPGGTQMRDIDF